MAFTTLPAVVAALPGQTLQYSKSTFSAQTANLWHSTWALGGVPAAGATPSSGLAGDVPTSATTGAFTFVNPAANNSYIARYVTSNTTGSVPMVVALYDRLWHNSGIDATSTGAQTINSVALTRPDALGAQATAWWHVYATMGAGTPTITLTYTDQDGNTGNAGTSGVLLTALAANRTDQFQLAAGDTGVKSIQTWQADATFTSGTIDLVIRRLVALAKVDPFRQFTLDAIGIGLPRVYDNACLELMIAGPTNALIAIGAFSLVNG